MEVRWLIKTAAAVGLEQEDAGATQITNAAISEHGYREYMRKYGQKSYKYQDGGYTQQRSGMPRCPT